MPDETALGTLIDQLVLAKKSIEATGYSDPDTVRVVIDRDGVYDDLSAVTVDVEVIGTEDPIVVIS